MEKAKIIKNGNVNIESIKIDKDTPFINESLKKHLQSIVDDTIRKEARSEAMRILMRATRQEVGEFLVAYYSDSTSCGLCCIALDFIKDRLVKEGKTGIRFGSNFGNHFFEQ